MPPENVGHLFLKRPRKENIPTPTPAPPLISLMIPRGRCFTCWNQFSSSAWQALVLIACRTSYSPPPVTAASSFFSVASTTHSRETRRWAGPRGGDARSSVRGRCGRCVQRRRVWLEGGVCPRDSPVQGVEAGHEAVAAWGCGGVGQRCGGVGQDNRAGQLDVVLPEVDIVAGRQGGWAAGGSAGAGTTPVREGGGGGRLPVDHRTRPAASGGTRGHRS